MYRGMTLPQVSQARIYDMCVRRGKCRQALFKSCTQECDEKIVLLLCSSDAPHQEIAIKDCGKDERVAATSGYYVPKINGELRHQGNQHAGTRTSTRVQSRENALMQLWGSRMSKERDSPLGDVLTRALVSAKCESSSF